MTKPGGAICNLDCAYCYFLAKEMLYPGSRFHMACEQLEAYTKQYIEAQGVPEVTFAWQGGEPTRLGLEFYRIAVELQQKHKRPGMKILNTLQTNGTLLDVSLAAWLGSSAGLCIFEETCGNALALEHNGDIYSCDHYVEPAYLLGNLVELPLIDMIVSEKQRAFGQAKRDTLPMYCETCQVRFVCNGGCPKSSPPRTASPASTTSVKAIKRSSRISTRTCASWRTS